MPKLGLLGMETERETWLKLFAKPLGSSHSGPGNWTHLTSWHHLHMWLWELSSSTPEAQFVTLRLLLNSLQPQQKCPRMPLTKRMSGQELIWFIVFFATSRLDSRDMVTPIIHEHHLSSWPTSLCSIVYLSFKLDGPSICNVVPLSCRLVYRPHWLQIYLASSGLLSWFFIPMLAPPFTSRRSPPQT